MWDHFDLMKGPCTPTCCTLLYAYLFCFLLAGSKPEPLVIRSTNSFVAEDTSAWLLNEAISSISGSEFTGGGRQCWGLVLKCYESRTRKHNRLKANALHPPKHYFPWDIMIFRRRLRRTYLHHHSMYINERRSI